MIKTSLFADPEREANLNKLGDALQMIEQHVDFAALAVKVDRVASRPGRERGGRLRSRTALMMCVPLIQQLFNLSDEKKEFRLSDRLSFKRFAGNGEKGLVGEGVMPITSAPAKRRQNDVDARWTKTRG